MYYNELPFLQTTTYANLYCNMEHREQGKKPFMCARNYDDVYFANRAVREMNGINLPVFLKTHSTLSFENSFENLFFDVSSLYHQAFHPFVILVIFFFKAQEHNPGFLYFVPIGLIYFIIIIFENLCIVFANAERRKLREGTRPYTTHSPGKDKINETQG